MKKTICMSAIVIFILVSIIDAGAQIWEEFSGIKWGAPLTSLKGLKEKRKDAYVNYFVRPGEIYTIDNLVLGSVTYGFYQNKFYAAFIDLDSRSHFNETMELLKLKYGKPRANLGLTQTVFIWDYQQMKIKLKHDKTKETFKIGFYFTPLSEALNRQRIAKGEIKIRKLE